MASTDKARRATTAADSALAAAKKAVTLSKSLPDKQARKLAPLIKDAKKAGSVTKKQLEDKPRRIERTATDAILALADATAKIERRLAEKADAKKSDAKKSDAKKSDAKKSDAKKTDAKKTDAKKTDAKKTDAKKTDAKKTDAKKTDAKKTDAKKTDAKKTDAKKTDAKKTDAKKTDAKKTSAKTDAKKARKRKSSPVPAVQVIEPAAAAPAATEPVTESRPLPDVRASNGATILHSMTVASLRARAKAEGRTGYSRLSKAELIALFV
ncbi:histone H1-like repetitive region-containing protein [Microbacterium sp. GXS0129]|uniref:histone H1-like repetitive region-containing protein n=1 Tax=Microbacterium sp. GXS0129 TaxID=3377836 RepID=UPI00383ACE7B